MPVEPCGVRYAARRDDGLDHEELLVHERLDGRGEQISQRRFVFGAVEPTDGDPALASLFRQRVGVETFLQSGNDDGDGFLVGARFPDVREKPSA